jgi:hypothetical protein
MSPALAWAAPPPAAPPAGATAPAPAAPPADSPPADVAAAHKQEGDQAMEALRYADALGAYGEAYAITRSPALLYNMGRALQALNRYPEALEKLEAFDATAPAEVKARVPRLAKLIAEIRQRVSAVTIHTNVDGARILVRDAVIGKSPLPGPVKLDAGPATIEADAEGYFPGKKAVNLPGAGELAVDLELFSRSTTGQLSVRASASGAEVLVDGKRIGIAPVELNVVKGTHQVVVRHPDYRLYETSAVVPAGGEKNVLASLQSPPVLTRWWFWTGVGVVVAAGVVVTAVALTERSPDSGTIAPGRLTTSGLREGGALFHF